ncbi:MAG: zinc carboxypeptidase [Flavobacteriales bacterium]|nr:zinc carboxypeptidase [Flavobacteriales bacterium]
MRKIICYILTLFLGSIHAVAQQPLSYFLPPEATYDPQITPPDKFLGWEMGKWHISHDKLISYLKLISTQSDRIRISQYGITEEERPLLLLTITSTGNHQQLEKIRSQHLELSDPERSEKLNIQEMPVIIYMGYSIHGNEASGTNAAMLMAYHLAAAQGPDIDSQLSHSVILLDPCMNPDGSNRFASWVNSHKSASLVKDPHSREFTEAWPNGRTNHYWSDLNRDWLPVQQIETEGRIEQYHRWMPNVLTDHHEMSTNSTFFFQPGIPSRTHPLTPPKNFELTEKIGKYHAAALDKIGSLYYTKESYDDFYYGKGSTYPDINGGVGILFEQASSRGHLQQSIHGPLSFAFTIRNQFVTSLSTLKASVEIREELLDFQRQFYLDAEKEAHHDPVKAFVVDCKNDEGRMYHFLKLLRHHKINIYHLAKEIEVNGVRFKPGTAYIMPMEQPQYRLIKAMFESLHSFKDSLFYDVSSWTLPLSFNLDFARLNRRQYKPDLMGEEVKEVLFPEGRLFGDKSDYGYVLEWDNYYAPRLVNALLKRDLVVKTATKPFTSFTAAGSRDFSYGTILIPAQRQGNIGEREIYQMLKELSVSNGVNVYSLTTGLTLKGIDIGSPSFVTIRQPKLLMVVGEGVSAYDAGEVWHQLDKRVGMQVVMVEKSVLNNMSFDEFNTIVMVEGRYGDIALSTVENIRQWIDDGGTLIAMRGAIDWCRKHDLVTISQKSRPKQIDSLDLSKRLYAYLDRDRGSQIIGGAIFNTRIDLTHPMGYGFDHEYLPVFRRDTVFYLPSRNPYATPVVYTDEPLMSGYISDEKNELLKSSAAVVVCGYGNGRIICIADDPNFRAFWFGTNKLFLNAIFFGSIINKYAVEQVPKQKRLERKEKSPSH